MPFALRLRARSLFFVITVALVIPLIPVTAGSSEGLIEEGSSRYTFRRTENCLMRRINRIRARHGLAKLERDKQLGYVARQHAETMASNRGVWHDTNVGWKVTRWERLGQNTGRGQSCKSLSRSFMASSSHRGHILGRFRHFAVGVQRAGGSVYVQELFESRRDPGNIYRYP